MRVVRSFRMQHQCDHPRQTPHYPVTVSERRNAFRQTMPYEFYGCITNTTNDERSEKKVLWEGFFNNVSSNGGEYKYIEIDNIGSDLARRWPELVTTFRSFGPKRDWRDDEANMRKLRDLTKNLEVVVCAIRQADPEAKLVKNFNLESLESIFLAGAPIGTVELPECEADVAAGVTFC